MHKLQYLYNKDSDSKSYEIQSHFYATLSKTSFLMENRVAQIPKKNLLN